MKIWLTVLSTVISLIGFILPAMAERPAGSNQPHALLSGVKETKQVTATDSLSVLDAKAIQAVSDWFTQFDKIGFPGGREPDSLSSFQDYDSLSCFIELCNKFEQDLKALKPLPATAELTQAWLDYFETAKEIAPHYFKNRDEQKAWTKEEDPLREKFQNSYNNAWSLDSTLRYRLTYKYGAALPNPIHQLAFDTYRETPLAFYPERAAILDWFSRFDKINFSGNHKFDSSTSFVESYNKCEQDLKALPSLPATTELAQAWLDYFEAAKEISPHYLGKEQEWSANEESQQIEKFENSYNKADRLDSALRYKYDARSPSITHSIAFYTYREPMADKIKEGLMAPAMAPVYFITL